jgi:hypothetical protein
VAERADGLAVREDDAEPELLDDEGTMLADCDVVAMAVKVSGHPAVFKPCTISTLFLTSAFHCYLFELNRQEPPLVWRTFADGHATLGEGGAVATQTTSNIYTLTTTGTEVTEGKHYWEVELLEVAGIFIGISRPNLHPKGSHLKSECTDSCFISATSGSLWGNGKQGDVRAGEYKQGDRVGMLLDLDNGSLRFFKNGVQHGSGYAAGSVAGPVVAAVQMYWKDQSVRMLPDAEAPAGV